MSVQGSGKGAALRAENERKALALIQEAIRGVRYGVISIILQDGLVVQVERTEKFRLMTHREVEGFRVGEGI